MVVKWNLIVVDKIGIFYPVMQPIPAPTHYAIQAIGHAPFIAKKWPNILNAFDLVEIHRTSNAKMVVKTLPVIILDSVIDPHQ